MKRVNGIIYVLIAASSYGIMAALVKLAYGKGYDFQEVLSGQLMSSMLILWSMGIYKVFIREKINDKNLETLLATETCYTDHVLNYANSKRKAEEKGNLDYKSIFKLLLLGMVGPGLTAILYFKALSLLPASVAIFLLFQFAGVSVIIDSALTKSIPNMIRVLALFIIIIGTILGLEMWQVSFKDFSINGMIYGLASAFTFAIFLYFTGSIGPKVDPWLKSPIMVTGATLIVFIIYPPFSLQYDRYLNGLILWVIPISIFGQVIPNLFFNIGLPIVGGKLGSFLGTAELPSTIIMAYFILGEQVTIIQWVGMLAVILGIVIANKEDRFSNRKFE